MNLDVQTARDFAIALLIGALVGLDREKKNAREGHLGIGGIRTFILFALAGGVTAWTALKLGAPLIFLGALLAATALVVAGYVMQARDTPGAYGLTTEISALVVFLLGGVALLGRPDVAVALAIAVSATLAFKQPLHGFVDRVGTDDIYAGLKLLVATFIVLPLLPSRAIDPWGALNPYELWWLVILISSLSLVGYLAVRWLGSERGTVITGLSGGLVSSTAVSLAFAKRSREEASRPGHADALAAGILVAWGVMFVRVLIEVAVVHPPLVKDLLSPFLVMGLVTLVLAAAAYRKSAGRRGPQARQTEVLLVNPFSLTAAIKFALFFAFILLLVKLVQTWMPGRGVYAVAALAGLTDVDAITLSMARQAKAGGSEVVSVVAIVIAALANTAVKAGLVVTLGSPGLRRWGLAAIALVVVSGAVTLALG